MAATMAYRCPHCSMPVEVDPAVSDETMTCPNEGCGKPFKTELPAAQPVPQALLTNGAALPAPPAAPAETNLRVIELALFRRFPLRWLVYGVLFLAALTGVLLGLSWQWPVLAILGGAAIALVAYRAVSWWLRSQNTLLRVTNRRIILENGVFAREAVEVSRGDIADIRVQQSLLGRLLKVGDMVIHTQGGEGKRIIQVMAVPDPEGVARLIRDRAV